MLLTFHKRLLRGIHEHLSSPKFHYVDNSLAYYNHPSPQNMQDDKAWFARHPLPDPDAFIQSRAEDIQAQVLTKTCLYELLADSHSRETLVLVALYALLGHRFVKFPYYTPHTLSQRKALASQYLVPEKLHNDSAMQSAIANDAFGVGYSLYPYSLPVQDEQINLYANAEFLYQAAYFPPYRYSFGETVIDVGNDDYVLDCGACYGDTALMFAAKVGKSGRVLSFEPHPALGKLYLHNRQLNPHLAPRMTLVPAATGSRAGDEILLTLGGPGSHTRPGSPGQQSVPVPVTSLDYEVTRRRWPRVDFIKMDVEGAELASLLGAEEILRRFRPRLAICLYHKAEDFFTIPQFLHELGLGYRFYVEHHFMNNWETVLYAVPK